MIKNVIDQLEFEVKGGKLEPTNIEKVFDANLPQDLTRKQYDTAEKYRAEFQASLVEAALPKAVEALKADKNLGFLQLDTRVGRTSFGAVLTRPTCENPTVDNYKDGISIWQTSDVESCIGGSIERAAALWAN